MKLRYKSFIFITPLIILPLMLVGVLSYVELKEISKKRVLQQSMTMLNQIALISQDKISEAQANVKLISSNPLLKQYALLDDEEARYTLLLSPLLSVFREIHKIVPDYYEIKFVLPDGYEDAIWLKDGLINKSEFIHSQPYFSEMLSSSMIDTKIIKDENTDHSSILIFNPIILGNPAKEGVMTKHKLRGFLTVTMNLNFLDNLVDQFSLLDYGHVVITDSNNQLLVDSQSQSNLTSETLVELVSSFSQTLDRKAEQTEESRHVFNGIVYLIHHKDLLAGMKAFSIVPENEVLAQGKKISNLVLNITLWAILISSLLLVFTLQKLILKPIHKLSEAAKTIGKGNIGHQIEITSRDEIGTLAKSINSMSKNLGKSLEKIQYMAHHDALTGLPNRNMFDHYFNDAISIAEKSQHKIALLYFDLDDFKQINDSLGHEIGDDLLIELGNRLSTSLRYNECTDKLNISESCDLLARLGGDEFVILLNDIDSPMDAVAVAERVLSKMADSVFIKNHELHVSCSIGITIYPDDAVTVSDLKKNADIAMYHAKDCGKNNYQFFAEDMNLKIVSRLHMKSRLKQALLDNQFILHYQPKVNPYSGKVTGMEALIRWQDPDKGLVYPNDFIDIAEESGLITPLTEWVLNKACAQNYQWQKAGLSKVPVSVNVSSLQFKRRDLIEMVENCLKNTQLEPEYLELELTESSLLEESDDAIETLNKLKDIGVSVALDDFGTGYSSLSYLEKFPIQILKIDRSFVLSITSNTSDNNIIDAIIALGHALNLKVIAEGVDDEKQMKYLMSKGCDAIQGFLYSKPLAPEVFKQYLESDKTINVT